MGNIIYALEDENSVEEIEHRIEALEKTNRELGERVAELEEQIFRLVPPEKPAKSGVDFKTIGYFHVQH